MPSIFLLAKAYKAHQKEQREIERGHPDPKVTIKVDTRVLDALIKNLDGNIEEAVKRMAYTVESKAKQKAPVDTGALRASIYTRMVSKKEAHVGPTVEYAAPVEFGTNRQAAQPYLTPAVREAEKEFRELLGKAVTNKIKGKTPVEEGMDALASAAGAIGNLLGD